MLISKLTSHIERASLLLITIFPFTLFLGSAVLDSTLTIVAILFILNALLTQNYNWLKAKWFQIFLLFWTYLIVRSIFSEYQHLSLSASLPFGRFGFFALAISFWLKKEKNLLNTINISSFFTVLIVSLSCVFQFIFGYDFVGNESIIHPNSIRLTTFAGKMNVGILLASLYIPVAANLWSKASDNDDGSLSRKALYWLFLCLPILAIFISGERTALILAILGLTLIFITQEKARQKMLVSTMILGVVIAALSFSKPELVDRQIKSTYNEINNFGNTSYGKIYKTALEIFDDNVLFGNSPKTFGKICDSKFYGDHRFRCATHPHNIYIEVLTDGGIAGFILFIFLLSIIFVRVYDAKLVFLKNPFISGAFLAFVFRYLPFISSGSFYIAWPMAASWFMLGICLSITKNEDVK